MLSAQKKKKKTFILRSFDLYQKEYQVLSKENQSGIIPVELTALLLAIRTWKITFQKTHKEIFVINGNYMPDRFSPNGHIL